MKPTITKALFATLFICGFYASPVLAGPARPFVNDDSIKVQLIRDWQRARTYTKLYIDAMPEDGMNFKPTPEIRSFAEQMLHLTQANISFISNATGKPKIYADKKLETLPEYKTKAALEKIVMESYDYAIDAIKGLDASKLSEIIKGAPADLSRLTWINKGFEHQSHHRGQCTIYLRLKGVTPPGEMLF